jgi:hypothetical protein
MTNPTTLSNKSIELLRLFGRYVSIDNDVVFGIFHKSSYSEEDYLFLFVKGMRKNESINFDFISKEDIIDVLDELSGTYLSYDINMHYYVELSDEGKRLAIKLAKE